MFDKINVWQNRPLEKIYPILYLDCIVVKCHQGKRVINKSIYLALAINGDGQKELLGLWIAENEGAKFWLSVLTELNNRGVQDIFIACVGGLTGFLGALIQYFQKLKSSFVLFTLYVILYVTYLTKI